MVVEPAEDDLQGQPQVPYLAVVLSALGAREQACSHVRYGLRGLINSVLYSPLIVSARALS
jgi:hypothetical protein